LREKVFVFFLLKNIVFVLELVSEKYVKEGEREKGTLFLGVIQQIFLMIILNL